MRIYNNYGINSSKCKNFEVQTLTMQLTIDSVVHNPTHLVDHILSLEFKTQILSSFRKTN